MTALAICLIVWMSVLILGSIWDIADSVYETDAIASLIRLLICAGFIIAISLVMF